RKAELVESTRGAHGGYRLARSADDIRMDEAILALEGSVAPMTCFVDDRSETGHSVLCSHEADQGHGCATKLLWTRVQGGVFMALQYPVAVPGVTVTKYLRMVMNAHRAAAGEPEVSLREFRKTVEEAMELVNVPREFSSRYLNDGFSGGEKKRMEILQLALQQPKIAVLDETDSGLDIDALNVVAKGVNTVARDANMGVLIITHYQRTLHMDEPQRASVMI